MCFSWLCLSLVPISLPLLRGSCPAGCASGYLPLLHMGGGLCREQEHFGAKERWLCPFIHSLIHPPIHSHTHIYSCMHSLIQQIFTEHLLCAEHCTWYMDGHRTNKMDMVPHCLVEFMLGDTKEKRTKINKKIMSGWGKYYEKWRRLGCMGVFHLG